MTTAAITGQSNNPYDATTAAATKSASTLSQEQFLQLLSEQFKQQDPFNPTSDTDFMAQMAQFSALEQMSELNREFGRFRAQNEFSVGTNLVGKEVTLKDENGLLVSGAVEGLHKGGAGYYVELAGELYPLSSVQSIFQPAPPSPVAAE